MNHEARIHINAPADIVWTTLSDVERWPEWTRSARAVELLDNALAVASRVRIRQPKFPPVVWTVTEVEAGRSFTWQARSPGTDAVGSHTVIDNGDGTSTAVLRIVQKGPIGAAIGLLSRRLTKRYVAMEADGLKNVAESIQRFRAKPREVW